MPLTGDQTIGAVVWTGSGDDFLIPVADFDSNGWFLTANHTTKQGGYYSSGAAAWVEILRVEHGRSCPVAPGRDRASGAVSVYINGTSVASATGQSNAAPTSGLAIAGYNTSPNFEGLISEVFVYSSALSAANLASIDANESTTSGDLGFETAYSGAANVQPGGR